MRALSNEASLQDLRMEFLESVVFGLVYEEAKNLFGEAAARQLVYKIMKEASKRMIERFRSQGFLELSEIVSVLSLPCKAFGIKAECKQNGDTLLIRAKECPLLKFDEEKDGKACITMISMLTGMIESVTGKRACVITPKVRFGSSDAKIVLKMLKSQLLGDEECLFEAQLR